MPEGKTVTIQHLSSEQAQQTATDTQLPDASSGGGIGGWISQHRMMLLIVGGGAVLGLIIYFYVKNQNAQTAAAATTDTGASTDGSTTSPDGSTSGNPTSGVDFSPIENLLNQLQQSSDTTNQDLSALLAAEGTPTSTGGGCPSGMHKCAKGCCCNGKNMVNKGDHCEKKGSNKGGAEDHVFALGGSDMFNDMFQTREPFRNTGHRMIYAMGGSVYHGREEEATGRKIEHMSPPKHFSTFGPSRQIDPWANRWGRHMGGGSDLRTMPPQPVHKLHHW